MNSQHIRGPAVNFVNHLFRTAIALVALANPAFAEDPSDLRKSMAVMTIPEIVMATLSTLVERFDGKIDRLSFYSEFSDRTWSIKLENSYDAKNKVEILLAGYTWGSKGQDHYQTYSGSGMVDDEPVSINGRITWPSDPKTSLFSTMNFDHVTKVGKNSFWGVVKAAEFAGCGVLAGVTLYALSVPPTGGWSLGLSPQILSTSAGIAGGCVHISGIIREFKEGEEPPEIETLPERPALPPDSDKLPLDDKVIIIVENTGLISGRMPASDSKGSVEINGDSVWKDGWLKGSVFVDKKN